ncbi:MAG: hypothetical protein ACP5KY_03160 [Thermoproteus sp.]
MRPAHLGARLKRRFGNVVALNGVGFEIPCDGMAFLARTELGFRYSQPGSLCGTTTPLSRPL